MITPLSADERAALVLVPLAFAAALWSGPTAWWPALVALVVGALAARPHVIVAGLVLLIAARSSAALADLQPVPTTPVIELQVELVTDPTPTDVSWRATAATGEGRVTLEARGAASAELSRLAAGDRLTISGTQRGFVPQSGWERSRALVGRLDVSSVHAVVHDGGIRGAATAYRRRLLDGARSLSPGHRALFAGLVYGDDREQRAVDADNFRAAGLGHLLAVSGQNVVFVLLVAAPVLSRVRGVWVRLAATAVVLVLFGFVTRFEPSVTRALVMAGLAAASSTRGSPAAAVRVLPPAVIGLLLCFPLLAWSLAFQLSVAATSGLVLLSGRIEPKLPVPRVLAAPLAATAAAQLAVSPLLLATFGSVSLLALPANLLAGPAAAFAMMWGLTAGSIAAVAPSWLAWLLHLPTRAAIEWIAAVASVVARQPVGQFGAWHLAALVVGAGAAHRPSLPIRSVGIAACALSILIPLALPPSLAPGRHVVIDGVVLYRSEGGNDVVVIDRSTGAERVLAALRGVQPDRIDLLIVTSGSRSAGRLVRVIDDRYEIVDVWAPAGHQVPGARVHPEFASVGTLQVRWPEGGDPVVTSIAGGSTATPSG